MPSPQVLVLIRFSQVAANTCISPKLQSNKKPSNSNELLGFCSGG
jgi:hypothetical protein